MIRELFNFETPASVADWSNIDDAVMGGQSTSRLIHQDAGFALFTGVVSLARGGGFASVRSRARDFAAPGAAAYVLEVCSDVRRYKLNLRTEDSFDGVSYQAAFEATPGQWTTVRLPLSQFSPTFRGRPVMASALDPQGVRQIGLMVADRQAGSFALGVRSIWAD